MLNGPDGSFDHHSAPSAGGRSHEVLWWELQPTTHLLGVSVELVPLGYSTIGLDEPKEGLDQPAEKFAR